MLVIVIVAVALVNLPMRILIEYTIAVVGSSSCSDRSSSYWSGTLNISGKVLSGANLNTFAENS